MNNSAISALTGRLGGLNGFCSFNRLCCLNSLGRADGGLDALDLVPGGADLTSFGVLTNLAGFGVLTDLAGIGAWTAWAD